ncbi:MAG: nuclear transport factor 2 family protein [Pirellulales bacterium]|nr:nuclear transport factor 2 family protein [Pirellulales bacterium]
MRAHLIASIALLCISSTAAYADESKAVLRANESFYAALNAMFQGDLDPMKQVWSYADDVTYLGPDNSFRIGWTATLEDWQKQAAMKLGGKVEPTDVHVVVGKDLAIVQNWEIGKNVAKGKRTTVKIRATNLYRKEDGKWKMIGHHTDLLPFLNKP